MASSAGTPGAAYSYSSGSYVAVAHHQLTRQRTTPATLVPVFAPCGGGGGGYEWPGGLGDGDGELRGRAPAAEAAAGGGVGAAARALWAWIGKGRKAAATMSRSASCRKERLYGHEEYAQNFDEGAAAGEPENLSRSFPSRYARRAAPWDGAR